MEIFFFNIHIPLLGFLVSLAMMMISLRIYNFFNSPNRKCRSLSGTSLALITTSVFFLVIYLILSICILVFDIEIFGVRQYLHQGPIFIDVLDIPWTELVSQVQFTDEQLLWMGKRTLSALKMTVANKFFITLVLWSAKGSLWAVYCGSTARLSIFTRRLVKFTGPILAMTLILGESIVLQQSALYLTPASLALLKHGIGIGGITVFTLGGMAEIILSTFNFLTDVLLTYIGYKIITSIGYPFSSGWLLYLMGALTITVATARVVLIATLINPQLEFRDVSADRYFISFTFTAECEAVFAIIVLCLPSLRAAMRPPNDDFDGSTIVSRWKE